MFKWTELFYVPPSILTVVGMAKNVGKTVTMNYIQKMLYADKRVFGLTSIGRDGESFDALTKLAKPAVKVQPGTLVATAEKLIPLKHEWEYLQDTSFETPLGKIVILKAKVPTSLVLAGPSKNHEVQELLKTLSDLKAECVLIDGAFDRQSSAAPVVSKQVVLATGATLCRNLEQLISITRSRVEQLTLSECTCDIKRLAANTAEKAVVISGSTVKGISIPTTLLSTEEWQELLLPKYDTLLVRGAVGEGLGNALLKVSRPPQVIIEDGSKVFLGEILWRQLALKGVSFKVRQAINLLGVTINPTYPGSTGFDPAELLTKMGKSLFPLPVIDFMKEELYKP